MGREGGKVEPGGIARYKVNVECGEHVGSTVSSVLEQSNLTILFWVFANSVGVCGVGVVLGTAVRSAWRV